MRDWMRVFVFAGLVALAGCKKTGGGSAGMTIAVIPKGTTHEFWKSVEAGAKQAGKELDAEIIWKGPLKEDDRAQQIQLVEQFVTDHVSGIVLAPLDKDALLRPVRQAADAKVPVVIIDSSLSGEPGKDFVSFVATDNRKGGEIAGEQLAKILNNRGKVVLLRYAEGSASTEQREAGFLEAIKKHPDIELVSQNRYSGATVDTAKTAALNMIDTVKQADGVFTPNESSTLGMLLAMRESGIAGKVKFVGFDASAPLVEALQKNEVDALVSQDPFRMGYEGVKTIITSIRGQAVPQAVDTGVHLITRENLNSAEITDLLKAR
jgi:ribose transport system substrate-binding protein